MLLPILLLGFVGASVPSPMAPESAGSDNLFHSCEAALRILDPTTSHVDPRDVGTSEGCLGYLQGFSDGGQLASWSICVGNASMTTLARVYVDYLRKNPQILEKPRSVGILLAFRQNFPCTVDRPR